MTETQLIDNNLCSKELEGHQVTTCGPPRHKHSQQLGKKVVLVSSGVYRACGKVPHCLLQDPGGKLRGHKSLRCHTVLDSLKIATER
jgi:hypothetical protein